MNKIPSHNNQSLAKKNKRIRKNKVRGAVFIRPNDESASFGKAQSKIEKDNKIQDSFMIFKNKLYGKRNHIPEFMMIFIVFIGVAWGLSDVKTETPIESVVVQGEFLQLDKSGLEKTLAPLVGSNYFSVDIEAIKNSLLKFAWVQSAQVRKIWPAQLEISIIENQAVALWGKDAFVNELGEVFRPEKINMIHLADLPDLNGLDKESDLVLKNYIQLSEMSRKHGFQISKISLVANNFWKIKFSNSIEIYLDKSRELESINTFFQAYKSNLYELDMQAASIDMRYTSGFTVRFSENQNIASKLTSQKQSHQTTSAKVGLGKDSDKKVNELSEEDFL